MSSLPFQEIMRTEAARAVQQNLKEIITAVQRGDFAGFLPEIIQQSPEDVKQDARERTWRTLLQQLGIDLAVALATVVGPLMLTLDVSSKEQWTLIGLSVLKTVISTAVSYVFRLLYAPKEESQITLAAAKKGT